ncbi:MAG: hypothetical protein KDI62_20870, partial [Anaerolineae bacterium]|nr:hypothetical protein [Anaerolineae bacterium]
LDDRPVELVPVDSVLQGIIIPAGLHTVQIKFWPGTFTVGLWLSVIGSLLCLVMMIGLRRK